MQPDQILIFRGCSWKKNMSFMNIKPPWTIVRSKKPDSSNGDATHSLGDRREEAIKNSRRHERLEALRGRTPAGSCQRDRQEVHQDR